MDALWAGVLVLGCSADWCGDPVPSAQQQPAQGWSLDLQQAGGWWGGSVAEKGRPGSDGCMRERENLEAWISVEGHARHALWSIGSGEEEGTE